MRVIDPGHLYVVQTLDANDANDVFQLRFVKRIGPKFPGNIGPAYAGTTVQEVLRACVDRLYYVNNQERDVNTLAANRKLQQAIYLLEERAARRHGREINFGLHGALHGRTCLKCGHVGCEGKCHP
jgi:hypothetical protein